MTDLQRELLSMARAIFDPRWWVLGLIVWVTRDLVLAGKLSGDAWAVLLTLAGGVLGVAVGAGFGLSSQAANIVKALRQ